MFKSLRFTLALMLPAVGALAWSLPAAANVRNTILGTACQFPLPEHRNGTINATPGPGKISGIYGYDDPGIWYSADNQDPNTLFGVLCPIVRNLPLSTLGLSDLEVRFKPTGGNGWTLTSPPRQVTCEATSYRRDGTIIDTEQMSVMVPAPTNDAVTATMDFGNAVSVSDSKGSYGLTCIIPVGVALHSIYTSELE